MYVADDMLGIALIHRQPGVLIFAHLPQYFLQAGVHRHRHDVVAGHHDFAHVVVLHFEQGLDGVLLKTMQMTLATTGADDELNFLGRLSAAAMTAAPADKPPERRRR